LSAINKIKRFIKTLDVGYRLLQKVRKGRQEGCEGQRWQKLANTHMQLLCERENINIIQKPSVVTSCQKNLISMLEL